LRIDPTIYAAIADDTLTIEQVCTAMLQMWEPIERSVLETVAADAIARGFNEADVRREIETHARELASSRAQRLDTLRQRLRTGSTHLQ
jgi:hypothetical protein